MKNRYVLQFSFLLLPILVSLVITALLVIVVGSDPIAVFQKVLEGAFRNSAAIAGVLNFWIPLTLCCMGLVITFTAGLWNIGVEGQMVFGALFASGLARSATLSQPVMVAAEIIAAMIGGILWALLVGVLKTRMGIHEIFGGVALNSLANVITIYLIAGPWAASEGANAQATPPF